MTNVFDFWVLSLWLSLYFFWVVYSLHYLCYNIILGFDNSAIYFGNRDFRVLIVVFMCCRLCTFGYRLFCWKLKTYYWKYCSKIFFITTKYYSRVFITWSVNEQCHGTSKKENATYTYISAAIIQTHLVLWFRTSIVDSS